MKLFMLAALVVASSVLAAPENKSKTLDDNLDMSGLNLEQLRGAAKCLCGDGPCNPVYASYKQYYPAVVVDGCRKCSESHKRTGVIFFGRLKAELPEEMEICLQKLDPQGIYFDTFYNNMLKG